MSIDNLSAELYYKIFDNINIEELLLLYKNPPKNIYIKLLKDYYNFEN